MANIPTGFRFRPTEEELINSYLRPKIKGQILPCDIVEEKQLYGGGNPWDVLEDGNQWMVLETNKDKIVKKAIYVFTKLTKKAAAGKLRKNRGGKEQFVRAAGCGTWDGQTGPREIKDGNAEVIGFMRMLVFEIRELNDDHIMGHYLMHEYSLPGGESDYVLCEIIFDSNKRCKRKRGVLQVADEERSKKRKMFENLPQPVDQIYGDGGQPSAVEEDDNESMLMIGNQIQQPLAAVEYVNGGQYQADDDEKLMMIQELGGNQIQQPLDDDQLLMMMMIEELGGNQIQQPLEAIDYVNGGQANDDDQLMNSTGIWSNHDDQNQQWDGLLSMEELSYICGASQEERNCYCYS